MKLNLSPFLLCGCVTFAAPKPPGGLAVQLGATTTTTAEKLSLNGNWLTLLLTPDATTASRLRTEIAAKGWSGLVTVAAHHDPKVLPLADHMANLILVEPGVEISQTEMLRVLVPASGRALLHGKTLSKPMPETMDGWTHFFHGPDGNKVSRDTAIHPPNGLRFIAGPRLQDSNGANGWRLDNGIAVNEWNYTIVEKDRPMVVLEGRDAFNGALLWQNLEVIPRGARNVKKTRPFIHADGRVLRIRHDMGKDGILASRIAAWDAKTGKLLRTYASSLNIREDRYKGNDPQFTYWNGLVIQANERTAVCFDAETDQLKWSYTHDRGMGLSRPIVAEDLGLLVIGESPGWRKWENQELRMALFEGRYPGTRLDALLGIDLKTGELKWRCETPTELRNFDLVEPLKKHSKNRPDKTRLHVLAYKNGRVFGMFACDANSGNPSVIWASDAKTGKNLWVKACGPVGNEMREMFDLFLLEDGSLFTYGHSWMKMDQASGNLLAFGSNGGNARCDTGACTPNLVTAGFGNYFDISTDTVRWTKRDLARGQCGGWGTPGYGMMFYKGSGCGCFFPLRGNLALHHAPEIHPMDDNLRRKTGSAIDRSLGEPVAPGDWPAYLYNGQRRAWNPQSGPHQLRERWRSKVAEPIAPDVEGVRKDWLTSGIYNGPVTAPVVAGGCLIVADRDGHRVSALDPSNGEKLWDFLAGGRVLTTPTLARGRVVFGARDGWVYCLDAKTGDLAWKFFAAPTQRFLIAYGQIESLWPVHGCLPVAGETVVASAGYHGEADGGIWAWGLDLKSGSVQWSRRLHRPTRPWTDFDVKQDKSGATVHVVRDSTHELASIGQSNGGYNPTKARNIDLPIHDHEVANIGLCNLVVATGQLAGRPVEKRLLIAGERYPFLDMEFENRGGPHSTGSIGVQFGDLQIGGHRSDGLRAAHNDRIAVLLAENRGTKGPKICVIDPAKIDTEEIKRLSPGKLDAVANVMNVPGRAGDSLALGGDLAYVASEGNLTRPWGHDGKSTRPRMRWTKGEAIPGHLEIFDIREGERRVHLQIDSAVINNGLAVANGRLYACCEDGTIRCYE